MAVAGVFAGRVEVDAGQDVGHVPVHQTSAGGGVSDGGLAVEVRSACG